MDTPCYLAVADIPCDMRESNTTPPDNPAPSGALIAWRAELHAGVDGQDARRPSTWLDTPLSRAAALEASGIECLAAGLPRSARLFFERADREVIEATAQKRKARAA